MKRWLLALFTIFVAWPGVAAAALRPLPPWNLRPPIRVETGPQIMRFQYGGEVLPGAQYLGPAHLGWIGVDVGLRMRNEQGLYAYARAASDPHSVYYRHFLTPEQIADFYGASAADYARAMQYFESFGLGVRAWKQREMLGVLGPQTAMEQAFHTQFGWFRKNGIVFYAPMRPPQVSVPIGITGVGGMVTYLHKRPHFDLHGPIVPFLGIGNGFLLGNTPFDIAAAFDYTGAYNVNILCCKGDGITIGIIGTGPINTPHSNPAGSSPGDAAVFESTFGVSGTGVVTQVNGTVVQGCCYSNGVTTPPAVTAPCGGSLPGCNPEDVEAQLDTEQTNSLAPNAQINFYLTYNPNECGTPGNCAPGAGMPQLGLAESDDEIEQIISDNVADVVSGSYGAPEVYFAGNSGGLLNANGSGFDPQEFASLAAEGIAVFFSSGDSGAEGCQRNGGPLVDSICVSYPSGDPNVVSVGGTNTPIGLNGQVTGPITTWGIATNTGGGGGGFSTVFSRDAFQPAGSFCDNSGHCDSSHRLQPDLALNADPNTGDAFIVNTGPSLGGAGIGSVGGTSAAAPDMAAMWALVLEACKQTVACNTGPIPHPYRLGNPRPLIYALSAAQKQSAFYDIVAGNNAVTNSVNPAVNDPGFSARAGFDLATGWGSPFARNLIKAIVGI